MGIETLSYNELLEEWLVLGNELQNLIRTNAKIKKGDMLDVTAFVNFQVDPKLYTFGKIIADAYTQKYGQEYVTEILTVESSGNAFAMLVAEKFYKPMIFARKTIPATVNDEKLYSAEAESYTQGEKHTIIVKKSFIKPEDRILIIDDFIARGNATFALVDIIEQAKAELAGIVAIITKDFEGQRGYKELKKYINDYNINHENKASVNTLVRITDMSTTPEDIIKIHRKLLPASKCSEIEDFWHVRNVPFQTDAGLTEFSFDSGFLGCQKCSSSY